MSTKMPNRKLEEAPVVPHVPPDAVQAAYQVHTLAQMLYGQIAATQPWAPWTTPVSAFAVASPLGFHPGVPQWGSVWGGVTAPFAVSHPFLGLERFPR
jgi:hypothetical protein